MVCRFPDTDTDEHVGYFPDVGAFLLLADGSFFRTRAGFQAADSWVDDDDRLHIDSDDARAIVDPRR